MLLSPRFLCIENGQQIFRRVETPGDVFHLRPGAAPGGEGEVHARGAGAIAVVNAVADIERLGKA